MLGREALVPRPYKHGIIGVRRFRSIRAPTSYNRLVPLQVHHNFGAALTECYESGGYIQ